MQLKLRCRPHLLAALLVVACTVVSAADPRFEFTSNYWFPSIRGDFAARPGSAGGSVSIDLRSDLAVQQRRIQSWGKLALKPSRKHRILVEGAPYRMRGVSDVERSLSFNGTGFVADRVATDLDLLYLFGGYQYDLINDNKHGHFGISAGMAFLRAEASLKSVLVNERAASRSIAGPLPMVGFDFEVPLRVRVPGISINGEARGMSVGNINAYGGRYVQALAQVGIRPLANLSVRVGWGYLGFNLHKNSKSPFSFRSNFSGPMISVFVRDVRGK